MVNIDDFNSARATGCWDLAGKWSPETVTFRVFPGISGKRPDSGGASLPSGSVLPESEKSRLLGTCPQMTVFGRKPARAGFEELSDYCVFRIRETSRK